MTAIYPAEKLDLPLIEHEFQHVIDVISELHFTFLELLLQ